MSFPAFTFWAPLAMPDHALQQRAAQNVAQVGKVTQQSSLICAPVFHAYK